MRTRTYVSGDEARLADLFNKSFPGGIVRTERSWRWRYVENPHFDPEGVIIAEENDEIKGYIVATPRNLVFKGQEVPSMIADDLCVSPEARGKGTGKTLLRKLMNFAQDRGALIMGYVGEGNVAHTIETGLGWSTVDQFVVLRRTAGTSEGSSRTTESDRRVDRSDTVTVRTCSESDLYKVIDFVNSANRSKMGSPNLSRSEYEWRYLTYNNSGLNSIFLAEKRERIVGHAAVSSHPSSNKGEKYLVVLSEPCGMIRGILGLLAELRYPSITTVANARNFASYGSAGFTVAGRAAVVAMDYSGLDMSRVTEAAEWYLFSESIFGEP